MDKMTETEVMGRALAYVFINEPTTFGKDECEKAMKVISKIAKDGSADDDICDAARARLGNHSAIRQWAVKQGFIPEPTHDKDALANETLKAMEPLAKAKDEALASLDKPAQSAKPK